jgi:pyrrolysyl-tRNA synthetase-like protein
MTLHALETSDEKQKTKRVIRKNQDPYLVLSRIKLWPSRKGILHGVRSVKRHGNVMTVITHCNQKARVRCSKNGRLARWLRNKWYEKACPECRVPGWKLEKYSQTSFVSVKGKTYDRGNDFYRYPKATAP